MNPNPWQVGAWMVAIVRRSNSGCYSDLAGDSKPLTARTGTSLEASGVGEASDRRSFPRHVLKLRHADARLLAQALLRSRSWRHQDSLGGRRRPSPEG